jgi:hypothetical protein
MDILTKLSGGDRRSIGRANEVVADVLKNPARFREVFDAMMASDPVVRMRAADVVEKVSAKRPDLLQPFARRLLDDVGRNPQQEVQWHVAQMVPRLDLTDAQRQQAADLLMAFLTGQSRITKVAAMQGLAELALRDPELRAKIGPMLGELTKTGSAAMQARGRTLLTRFARAGKAAVSPPKEQDR